MRCLFTMFAEDVGSENEAERLIPNKGFEKLLHQMIDTPAAFRAGAGEPVARHGHGRLRAAPQRHDQAVQRRAVQATRGRCRSIRTTSSSCTTRRGAAGREVEPAIFGTLLESALDPRERSKLGAHYTPRAYVERLVIPTIIEPLRADWEEVQARVEDLTPPGRSREGAAGGRAISTTSSAPRACSIRPAAPAISSMSAWS